MNDVHNKNVQSGLRRRRRFFGRIVGCVGLFLMLVVSLSASADDTERRDAIHQQALRTAGILNLEWLPDLPVVAIPADKNAGEPLLISSESGALFVAAESRAGDASTIVLAQSKDGGSAWDSPRDVARAGTGKRITAGAGGALPSGRLILALHEWSEKPGTGSFSRRIQERCLVLLGGCPT